MSIPMRLALFLLLASSAASAQPQFVVHAHLGLDQHDGLMGVGLWQANEAEAFDARGISVEATDAFPSHVSTDVSVGVRFPRFEVGLSGGYGSTGGRLAYSDYSGSMVVERIAERTRLGAYVAAVPLTAGPVNLGGGAKIALSRTTVSYDRLVLLGEDRVESVTTDLTATPLSLEPFVHAQVRLFGPVRGSARVGYELAQASELTDLDTLPAEAARGPARVGWSGLRTHAGLSIQLGSGS
ncbi:MAG: hypothetical protein Rubg2KO_25650 [Rubricoccaceae bacterium]